MPDNQTQNFRVRNSQLQNPLPQNLQLQNSQPVILVVDDDESIRMLLRHLMEAEGYRVIEAVNGEEAIAIHRTCRVDLVLLDGAMPKMNGFICCQHLSTSSNNPGSPIMMLTSLDDDRYIDRALAAGATDYLTKPFNWALLCQRVRHLLKMHCADQELQRQSQRSALFKTIAQCIAGATHSDAILSVAVAETRRLLQVDRVLIYRLNPDRSGVVCAESVSAHGTSLLGQSIHDPCFASQFDLLYQSGHLQIVADIDDSNLPDCYIDLLAQFQVRAIVVVPILLKGHLWGFLIVHHCASPRTWAAWEVELIEHLAAQLSIAIQQLHFYQHVQQFSTELERYVQGDSVESERSSQSQSALATILQPMTHQVRDLLSESQRLQRAIQESNWLITDCKGLNEC